MGTAADDGENTPQSAPAADAGRRALVALLARVADGDRGALEALYQRTATKLFGVCLRILTDRSHAEEALQETYLAIWRRAGAFDATRGTVMTWLLTIARNAAVDRRRALGRHDTALPDLIADPADPAPGPLDSAVARDETQRLHLCLDTLEALDRGFLAAAFFQGATYSEVAARAAMPLPTVKSRIRRALLKLRECLT